MKRGRCLKKTANLILRHDSALVRAFLEPDDTLTIEIGFVFSLFHMNRNNDFRPSNRDVLCYQRHWIPHTLGSHIGHKLVDSAHILRRQTDNLARIRNTNKYSTAFRVQECDDFRSQPFRTSNVQLELNVAILATRSYFTKFL